MFKVHKGVSDTLDKLKDWKATVSESLKQIVNTQDMNKKTEATMTQFAKAMHLIY